MGRKKGRLCKTNQSYWLDICLHLTREGLFTYTETRGWENGEVSDDLQGSPSANIEDITKSLIEKLSNTKYYFLHRSVGSSKGRGFPENVYRQVVGEIIEQIGQPCHEDYIEGYTPL